MKCTEFYFPPSGTVIQRKKDVRAGSEAPMPDVGSAPESSRTQTLSTRRRPACPATSTSSNGSEPKEEGSYSISNAALTYTATYSRTASPPRKFYNVLFCGVSYGVVDLFLFVYLYFFEELIFMFHQVIHVHMYVFQ